MWYWCLCLTARVKATDRPWACWPAGCDNVRDHWNSERVAWHDMNWPTPALLVILALASKAQEDMEIHEMCFSVWNRRTFTYTANPWDSPYMVTGWSLVTCNVSSKGATLRLIKPSSPWRTKCPELKSFAISSNMFLQEDKTNSRGPWGQKFFIMWTEPGGACCRRNDEKRLSDTWRVLEFFRFPPCAYFTNTHAHSILFNSICTYAIDCKYEWNCIFDWSACAAYQTVLQRNQL